MERPSALQGEAEQWEYDVPNGSCNQTKPISAIPCVTGLEKVFGTHCLLLKTT